MFNFFKKKDPFQESLDKPLFSFPGFSKDFWSIAYALLGTLIVGGSGSGKTSGPGKLLAESFLRMGLGGLILCAKPDERLHWEEYAKKTGREKDLVIFSKDSPYAFNPLEYEMTRRGKGAGETINIVNMIMVLFELGRNFSAGSSGGGGENDRFWDNATRRCINRLVSLQKLSGQPVSIYGMRKILIDAFSPEDANKYMELVSKISDDSVDKEQRDEAWELYEEWANSNYFLYCFSEANAREDMSEEEIASFQLVGDYWLKVFPGLPEKTKSIVVESFMGLVEPFLDGLLKSHFAEGVSKELLPEKTFTENKIIILDFPIKEFLLPGVFAQGIFKYIWQQEMERRKVMEEDSPSPVFLWIDESQFFINPEYDTMFQTTARSSLVCSVYLTQNINNYFFTMGNRNPMARAKSLFGNLATKYFCANSDYDTNKFASEMLGKEFIEMSSLTINAEKKGSKTFNQQLHWKVPPDHFTTLKSGRAENKYKVESIVFMTGKRWSNGENFMQVAFDQRG